MFGPIWFTRRTARMFRGPRTHNQRPTPQPSQPMGNVEEWVMLYLIAPPILIAIGIAITSPLWGSVHIGSTTEGIMILIGLFSAITWFVHIMARYDRKNPPPDPYTPPQPPKPRPPTPPKPPRSQAYWSDRR